ncbi:MAG: hypothetical protein GWO02_19720, partial [Gammaproteobacteria bacterium]|nr:hypothetical protein [Gammaproteobacteria bacterium]
DICPKRFIDSDEDPGGELLTRCCLLQEGFEERQSATFVPWGATLTEVRGAIDAIVRRAGVAWTPI